jgi:hypothetical protein
LTKCFRQADIGAVRSAFAAVLVDVLLKFSPCGALLFSRLH